MNIQAYIPQGPLREFVDSIHFLSGKQMGTGVAFPRMHQVIIINLGTRFTSSDVYAPATTRETGSAVNSPTSIHETGPSVTSPTSIRETGSSVWINGKQDAPFMLGNDGETAMYAIGLMLGMFPFFAALPALETNNGTIGAENWTSNDIFDLREQLLACPPETGFTLIEQHLLNLLRQQKDFSRLDRVKWLGRALYTYSVEQICTTLGYTRKRLRNEALHYFGGSVKNIQGIIRLNRTLQKIADDSVIPLSGLATLPKSHAKTLSSLHDYFDQAGLATPPKSNAKTLSRLHDYFDQAHFIHDFKARTGITPLQYRRLCREFPYIARTPNFIALPRETFLQFISGAAR